MVEAAPKTRDQIKSDLLAQADNYFATFEDHKVVMEDTARNYVARQTFDESGNVVTIIKFRCDGFTEEHFQRWRADPIAV